MKQNKWLKWKLGAIASVGMALLFQQIRTSDAFELARSSSQPTNAADSYTVTADDDESIYEEWQNDSSSERVDETDSLVIEDNEASPYTTSNRENRSTRTGRS